MVSTKLMVLLQIVKKKKDIDAIKNKVNKTDITN